MTDRTITVWDPLVRLFHWSLAVSFAVAWLTAEGWDGLHEWAGYAAAALIAFRLLWGLVGPRYARFAQFVPSPAAATRYVSAMSRGREPRYIGHNPAGGLMVITLLLALAGTAPTGWMSTFAGFWSADWLMEIHEALASLTLALVVVHIAGVLFASLRHKENLVRSMIGGRKRTPEAGDVI